MRYGGSNRENYKAAVVGHSPICTCFRMPPTATNHSSGYLGEGPRRTSAAIELSQPANPDASPVAFFDTNMLWSVWPAALRASPV